MLRAAIGFVSLGLMLWVFVGGLRAARTRKIAMLGMIPAGCSLGAFVWSAAYPEVELIARFAAALAAVAGGMAHSVALSTLALPARRVWLRLVFVPIGLWAGATAATWFLLPEGGIVLGLCVAILLAGTVLSWILFLVYGRDVGFVEIGTRKFPSVRFPCPRCGTRVDWGQGMGVCTDCGLFMHIHWPVEKPARASTSSEPSAASELAGVHFACPSCGLAQDWPRGEGACPQCGLKLSLHWNVHTRAPERP